jgi:hypothetical protein
MLQSSSQGMQSLSQLRPRCCTKDKVNTTQVIFHYMKTYEYIMQPLIEVLASWVNAVHNNKKCTKNLTTYRKVLSDDRSMNSEPQSHLLAAAYMSRVESLRLVQKDPPRLEKACIGLWLFGSFKVQNLLPESCVNICSPRDITSWFVGAYLNG